MKIEFLIVSVLRSVVEVALLSLLGQGALSLLAGAARKCNPIYRFFCIISGPPIRAMRFVMPKLIIDKHIPVITFCVLFWLWILLAYLKRSVVGSYG